MSFLFICYLRNRNWSIKLKAVELGVFYTNIPQVTWASPQHALMEK